MDFKLFKTVSEIIPRLFVDFLQHKMYPLNSWFKTDHEMKPIYSEYVSYSKKLLKHRRIIPDTVLESLGSILLDSKKSCSVRTHPEELHTLKGCLNFVCQSSIYQSLRPRSSSG